MANFAKILNNVVIAVVAVNNDSLLDENKIEQEQKGIDFLRSTYREPLSEWKQTSYNTYHGEHKLGGTSFRIEMPNSFTTTIDGVEVELAMLAWNQEQNRWENMYDTTSYIWNPVSLTWEIYTP